MTKAQVGVLLALAALLAPAAPAAPPTPGGSLREDGAPCPPCHCKDDTLDCTGLPAPRDASWMQALTGWNETGLTKVLLDGVLPSATLAPLPAMPGVSTLSLRNNGLTDIASGAFLALSGLRALDLAHNKLTADAVRADVLRGAWQEDSYEPLSLTSLDLSHNDLHSLPRRALEHTKALRVLRLDGNPLRVLDHNTQAALAGAESLQVLGLSGCGLAALPADAALGLPRVLHTLDVSRNALTAVPRGLPSTLRRLVLDANPVRTLPAGDSLVPPFLHLDNLEELSLSYMPILEEVQVAAFFGLPRLRALSMAHNKALRQVHPAAFSHLGPSWTLTEVSLRNNSLRSLPPRLLAWAGLTFLDVADNPWHCSCNFTTWAAASLKGVNVNTRDRVRCSSPAELSGQPLWDASSTACSPELRDGIPPGQPSLFANALLFVMTASLVVLAVMVVRRLLPDRPPRLYGRAALARSSSVSKDPLYEAAAVDED
ncbi:biglycan-like, partial [Thrips palmi]|uniref:Biglycan-like n=1 Tax=Thrips palmi TaxID=161013 RepID=A0A6P8ZDN1_THRPL